VGHLLEQTPLVLLAGGLGSRLRPVVADRPKGLAPVGGEPFLKIQIDLLRRQGARQFVLCVGWQAEQVRDFFGDGAGHGVDIVYSMETRLLGTGGALRLAGRFFQPRALVLNGDTYLAADYEAVLRHHLQEHENAGAAGTLALAHLDDASRYGSVELDSRGRFLTGFAEKKAASLPGWVNAGAYVLERCLLDLAPPETVCSLEREVFPAALTAGLPLAAWRSPEPFHDIGTPDSLAHFVAFHEQLRTEERSPAVVQP
jgi:NDP-sugar pyrophosphorylase family protein